MIGTASARNHDLVRQLGADEVIDYQAVKFEEITRDVGVVLDTVGGDTEQRSWRVLKRGGILVSIVSSPSPSPEIAKSMAFARHLFLSSPTRPTWRRWQIRSIRENCGPSSKPFCRWPRRGAATRSVKAVMPAARLSCGFGSFLPVGRR